MGAKVRQEPDTQPGRLQVIVNLGTMLVVQPTERLDFENDLVEQDEIGLISLFQQSAFVLQSALTFRALPFLPWTILFHSSYKN